MECCDQTESEEAEGRMRCGKRPWTKRGVRSQLPQDALGLVSEASFWAGQ